MVGVRLRVRVVGVVPRAHEAEDVEHLVGGDAAVAWVRVGVRVRVRDRVRVGVGVRVRVRVSGQGQGQG